MNRYATFLALLCCSILALDPADAGAGSGPSSAALPGGMKWVTPGIVRLSRYDPGGYLARYLADLEKLKRLGMRQLQLDTTCASACTIYLQLGGRVCVTDRARIGFHRITLRGRSRFAPIRARIKSAEHDYNDRFLQRLPANIRSWRGIRGGLPRRMVWLKGAEAARRIGRCR
ncbi:MAG TPA: hypothetical protein VLA28_02445 [Afifellaceae bacterium]|nr:hypothetical protein [Afifellaceae bacterium]